MLLYIRDAEREQILAPVLPEEIPAHLRERFEKQEAEKAAKKKEKAEAHLYLELKVRPYLFVLFACFSAWFLTYRNLVRWLVFLITRIGMALICVIMIRFCHSGCAKKPPSRILRYEITY